MDVIKQSCKVLVITDIRMEIVRTSGFTRLSSNIVQENREAPEPVQSGRHLVGSCHRFERTGSKKGSKEHMSKKILILIFYFQS